MQLKYCFKKEWSQYVRTVRLTVIIIVFAAGAVLFPALFGFVNFILQQANELPDIVQSASISFDDSGFSSDDIMAEIGMDEMLELYSDAGTMFAVTATSVISTGALVTMLLLMPAAGGEQKKRAMIVPLCSGLSYKNYLIPKFVVYPASLCIISFLSVSAAGLLCNTIFPNNHVSADRLLLIAFLSAVYVVFLTTIHLSLGICTSRPGIMVAAVYLGSSIIENLLQGFGLAKFHPFALTALITQMGMLPDYSIAEDSLNIIVSVIIAMIICVVMFFLALGVLSANKINNREEIKPEF